MKIAYSTLSSCAFTISLLCVVVAAGLDLSSHMQFVFLDWTIASLIFYILVIALFSVLQAIPKTWPPRSWFW